MSEISQRILIGSRESEIFCVIKCLCDANDLSPDDIVAFPYIDTLEKQEIKHLKKTIRTIPLKIDLPSEIGSKKGSFFLFGMKPAIKTDANSALHRRLGVSLNEFQISSEDRKRTVTYWRWIGERDGYPMGEWLYFVQQKDLFSFYRIVLSLHDKQNKINEPILPAGMSKHIYDNTIGFILRGNEKKEQYKKYNIPFRRGVLLVGEAGAGKTLTCKWIRNLCIKNKIPYRIISLESYTTALGNNDVKSLFVFPDNKSGIIFFDDLDQAVKSRESGNTSVSHFLTNLDGLETQEGAVCIFTSNYTSDLDKAFVRRGRIDVFITFKKPYPGLRREFINSKFEEEVKKHINIDALVEKSENMTFAELEEIRKLICLDLIDGETIDLDKILHTFSLYKTEFENRLNIGFGNMNESSNDMWDENCFDKRYI